MDKDNDIAKALDAYQVALAMDGDRAAFSELYRRWHPRLLRFAMRLTGNGEDARDVMQESALAIATNIHRLNDPAVFSAWAFTIVRRRAADHVRSAVRRRAAASDYGESIPLSTPAADDEHIALSQALSRLKPADQALLTLFYLEDLTGPELASVMGIPLGTLKSRLFDARQHLKAAYETKQRGETDE